MLGTRPLFIHGSAGDEPAREIAVDGRPDRLHRAERPTAAEPGPGDGRPLPFGSPRPSGSQSRRDPTTSDLYTKIILTVIAGALCAIVVQSATQSASAIGTKCFGSSLNPCVVAVKGEVDVRVVK